MCNYTNREMSKEQKKLIFQNQKIKKVQHKSTNANSLYNNDKNPGNGIRLNKYLSDSGICSRREADRLIEAGKVTIDGQVAQMGQKVLSGQKVCCCGKEANLQEELVLLVFNKPVGIECTSDRDNPDNIIDFIQYPKRIFSVGRLDKNSSGLILMTNDGDLANKISKSVNCHEKEYIVRVNKKITNEFIEKMGAGVSILDTITKNCTVEKIDENTFSIILTQGLNRQIRRMCEALGYRVIRLERIRVMNIRLGKLKSGTYRKATTDEINELLSKL